jgi:hypothetical protein
MSARYTPRSSLLSDLRSKCWHLMSRLVRPGRECSALGEVPAGSDGGAVGAADAGDVEARSLEGR